MTVGAKKVSPLSGPGKISHPFAMDACLPIIENRTMTFTAEPIAHREVNQFPVVEPELISILSLMTIQTPPHCLCVMQLDLGMFLFQFPFFSIHFHRGVTIAAWK
jgi:hypothetical protein